MLATEISYKELLFNFPFRNNKAPVETKLPVMHAPSKLCNSNAKKLSSAPGMACTSASTMARSNKESLEDCTCTICLCILIHPVTLPCGHELCMPCFKQTVEEASLSCPLCRTRISTWTRRASKAKTLVDQKRWEQIQRLFPARVQRRLDGLDDETDEEAEEKEEICKLAVYAHFGKFVNLYYNNSINV